MTLARSRNGLELSRRLVTARAREKTAFSSIADTEDGPGVSGIGFRHDGYLFRM
jgi:hypothetical protein